MEEFHLQLDNRGETLAGVVLVALTPRLSPMSGRARGDVPERVIAERMRGFGATEVRDRGLLPVRVRADS